MADGGPWVRLHFRPANPWPASFQQSATDPSQGAPMLNRRLNTYAEEYKQQLRKAGRGDEVEPRDGNADEVSDAVLQEAVDGIVQAVRQEQDALRTKLDALAQFNRDDVGFDDRCKLFARVMAKVMASARDRMEARDILVMIFEALAPNMAPAMKTLGEDAFSELARMDSRRTAAAAHDPAPDDPGPGRREKKLHMEDSCLNVIQCRSDVEAWEATANYGFHPGCLFGAHGSAFFGLLDSEALYGNKVASQDKFDETYPNLFFEENKDQMGYGLTTASTQGATWT